MDTNGRYSQGTNGQSKNSLGKKNAENQPQNGNSEKLNRDRPAGASVMNARDPMSKQKMSNICEPGPLKRAQGKNKILLNSVEIAVRFLFKSFI